MSTHDPISDLITRIRNAQMRAKPKVSTPGSKMRANVLEVGLCLGEKPAAREQRSRNLGVIDTEGNYG